MVSLNICPKINMEYQEVFQDNSFSFELGLRQEKLVIRREEKGKSRVVAGGSGGDVDLDDQIDSFIGV